MSGLSLPLRRGAQRVAPKGEANSAKPANATRRDLRKFASAILVTEQIVGILPLLSHARQILTTALAARAASAVARFLYVLHVPAVEGVPRRLGSSATLNSLVQEKGPV